jgi:hypothetical protein
MEGNMRGPSIQDCEKSFARTGILSARLLARKSSSNSTSPLIAISPVSFQLRLCANKDFSGSAPV